MNKVCRCGELKRICGCGRKLKKRNKKNRKWLKLSDFSEGGGFYAKSAFKRKGL